MISSRVMRSILAPVTKTVRPAERDWFSGMELTKATLSAGTEYFFAIVSGVSPSVLTVYRMPSIVGILRYCPIGMVLEDLMLFTLMIVSVVIP